MKIGEIKDKNLWEDFLSQVQEKTFLQSWNWGEFQTIMGNKVFRLGVFENEKPVAISLVSKIRAKRGTFLLLQHGPILKTQNHISKLKTEILKVFLEELKKIAKDENCSFIRTNSLWKSNQENQDILKSFGFKEAPMHANAYEATLKLNLIPATEDLLMNMRKSTRYLIRQALKNPEIEVIKSDRVEDAELYDKLNRKVSKHQQFVPFSFEFVKNEFKVFAEDNQALFFFGKYQGEVIASALIIFWSGIAFYHQAALHPQYHKIPIAYLLQWEAIKEAKKRGCLLYDFWGFVDPKKQPEHPWAGPTLFKMGFGGYQKEYVKTQDLPLNFKYWFNYIFEKLRKKKRGL